MVAVRPFSGLGSPVGKPRAPDMQALFKDVETALFDIGKGGRVVRRRRRTETRGSEHSSTGRGGRFGPLALSAQQRLAAARRLPPAIVKIIPNGTTGTKRNLRSQVQYLTREGDLAMTDQDGLKIKGDEDVAELIEAWSLDFQETKWKHKTTHLLVSSPQGTDVTVLDRAAARFAETLLGGGEGERWDYVHVRHTDTDYPHVHFIVNNLGLEHGKQFKVWRDHTINVPKLRTMWTEAARAEGLYLDDTPRRSRGLPPAREKTPDWRRKQRGEVSDHYAERTVDAVKQGAAGKDETLKERRFKRAFRAILRAEQRGYSEAAASLRAGAEMFRSEQMRQEAEELEAFAERMTMPLTDIERILNHIGDRAEAGERPEPSWLLGAAMTMIDDSHDGKGWRVMSETEERDHGLTDEEISDRIKELVESTELVLRVHDDPAERTRLEAFVGEQKGRLAPLVIGRPEWHEHKEPAIREPASAERAALKIAASDAAETRIMAEADNAAMRAFQDAGLDGELALERLRFEGPVDRATAARWRGEETEEAAHSRHLDERDAVFTVERAHETVHAIYVDAAKRLRKAAPSQASEHDDAARRAVAEEQRDMDEKARKASKRAEQSRGMKR